MTYEKNVIFLRMEIACFVLNLLFLKYSFNISQHIILLTNHFRLVFEMLSHRSTVIRFRIIVLFRLLKRAKLFTGRCNED